MPPPLTGLDQQAGPGRQPVAGRRGLVFGRERRHADDHGAAGRRPGQHRHAGGTMVSGVHFLSVGVVVVVQPRDRTHRGQDQERQRQMDDGHPEQRGVGAADQKHRINYCHVIIVGRTRWSIVVAGGGVVANVLIRVYCWEKITYT